MDILISLIQIRKDRKTGLKQLAGKLGITSTTLGRYESGKRKMPIDILVKYAEYFDYEVRLLKK